MKDRAQILMMAGLAVLFLTVLHLTTSGLHFGFLRMNGALPWIMLAIGFWLFYGKRGGCSGDGKNAED